MNTRPVTEARIWFLMVYRRYREEGRRPLNAAQLAYDDALRCPDLTRREWRKYYAQRYFKIISLRSTPTSLHGDYWKYGTLLAQHIPSLDPRRTLTRPYPKGRI
jgi:hypothetical protein